jgi:N6-adenosine-specific RNA methylase IME4/ParB-like chromosome segregation protein Spo0J
MAQAELQALADDIKANGQQHPITTYQGEIIDGRNRWLACEMAGVKPTTRDWGGGGSLVAYVLSLNLHRRQLTASQKAMVAAEALPMFEAEAAKRRRETEGRPSKVKELRPKMDTVSSPKEPRRSDQAAAETVGVSRVYVAEAKALKAHQPALAEKVKAGTITLTQAKREIKETQREQKRAENADPLEGKYSTILMDPPWDWGDEGDGDQLGRARPDYATMSVDGLAALKLPADEDCHLYMWITNRSMPKAHKLLDAWGFRFVTVLTWPKSSFGMGNYFRGQTEHVIFGVKGSLPLKRKDASTLLPAWKRGPNGHSSKPAEMYEFVESCSPGPYLEMFSRASRPGWRMWGE